MKGGATLGIAGFRVGPAQPPELVVVELVTVLPHTSYVEPLESELAGRAIA